MYGSGGGGHLASARAVAAALEKTPAFASTHIVLVDAARIAGAAWADSLYNALLARDALPLVSLLHAAAAAVLPIVTPTLRDRFRRFWTTGVDALPDGVEGNGQRPDVVVSFVPQLNAVMGDVLAEDGLQRPLEQWSVGRDGAHGEAHSEAASIASGRPAFFTVLTDFAHSGEHPWLQSERQWVVCGTEKAYRQAETILPDARRTRVPGMVVHPKFYQVRGSPTEEAQRNTSQGVDEERNLLRHALFDAPGSPSTSTEGTVAVEMGGRRTVAGVGARATAAATEAASAPAAVACEGGPARESLVMLLLFGADPPRGTVRLLVDAARRRTASGATVDLIVVCGRNGELQKEMTVVQREERRRNLSSAFSGSDGRLRLHVTGFTREVPTLMRAADVLVGKPGPGVISEALVVGLPVVMLVGPTGPMRQESDVAEWVLATGVGRLARTADEVLAVGRVEVGEMRRAIASLPENDSVFRVAQMIAHALPVERWQRAARVEQEMGVRIVSSAGLLSESDVSDASGEDATAGSVGDEGKEVEMLGAAKEKMLLSGDGLEVRAATRARLTSRGRQNE